MKRIEALPTAMTSSASIAGEYAPHDCVQGGMEMAITIKNSRDIPPMKEKYIYFNKWYENRQQYSIDIGIFPIPLIEISYFRIYKQATAFDSYADGDDRRHFYPMRLSKRRSALTHGTSLA